MTEHPELKSFRVYASDGHYEAAATHTHPVEGDVVAPGYFYSTNLRSHGLALLDIARPTRKEEHDMYVLKRLSTDDLRLGAPKGVKVIHVYDCAGIDFCLAHNLMLLLERDLAEVEGVEDEKVRGKRRKRLETLRVAIVASGRQPNPMLLNCIRITQRSLQFIRWLRSCLRAPASWRAEVDILRPLMATYLS